MKFGKLSDISHVDFQLPPDAAETATTLVKYKQENQPLDFYIGCTGWSMKEWVGSIYPKNAKAKDFLKYYTEQFNTIELNTTHYRIPTLATIQKWKDQSVADFKFCPKVPQTISHSKSLGIGTSALQQFCDAVANLEDKLGCCFIQLPPYFGVDRMPLLLNFIDQFPSEIPLAIEFRHESWFSQLHDFKNIMEHMEQKGVSSVISDVAGRRDVLHMHLTTSTAMIRFVGNGLHPTDFERVNTWIDRLQQWQQLGLTTVYFFTHEPDNIQAPELARFLFEKILPNNQIQTRGPKFLEADQGEQMSLFS